VTTSAERTGVTGTELRTFMRNWPTGAAIVTAARGPEPVGCTVNSFTSVSLHPPSLLVSLTHGSVTLAAITASGAFGVTVLGFGNRDLVGRFATACDRFAGLGLRWRDGVPLPDLGAAQAVCAVRQLVDVADHTLVIGTPRFVGHHAAEPLVLFDARSHTLPRPRT
jgi:flavin reductase (DIM6/NTAB) family NADH-FMN oxidoreductase RutF